MDSITPLNIAGGFAQSSEQQRQVAGAQDAGGNRAHRLALRLRKKHEEDAESVEDAVETADDHAKVDDESGAQHGQNQQQRNEKQRGDDRLDIQA